MRNPISLYLSRYKEFTVLLKHTVTFSTSPAQKTSIYWNWAKKQQHSQYEILIWVPDITIWPPTFAHQWCLPTHMVRSYRGNWEIIHCFWLRIASTFLHIWQSKCNAGFVRRGQAETILNLLWRGACKWHEWMVWFMNYLFTCDLLCKSWKCWKNLSAWD